MKEKHIIIMCPANIITGGVNSLLNLCSALNRNGFSAKMFFYDIDNEIISSQLIKSYNIEHYTGDLDLKDQIIIVSESQVARISNFTKATKIVYWLGLLYYYKNPEWKFPFNYKIIRKLIACYSYSGYSNGIFELSKRKLNEYAKSKINIWTDDYIHLSNSYFVTDFCKNKGAKYAYTIQNPVHDEFYNKQVVKERKKYILFGQRSSKLFMWITKLFFKDYKITKLKRISHEDVVEYLSQAMVFIELGINHGRDRLPREAALQGCVIFMNRRGSSSNKLDYNLDGYYLLRNNIFYYYKILKKIKDAINNRSKHIYNQSILRQQLIEEKINFDTNVKNVFNGIF